MLVPSRGLCRFFVSRTMNITNEMQFPLDNSVCRVETTCPLVRLDNLVAVPIKLMRCSFQWTAPSVESRQLVRSYKLWKVFFHLCHVDSIGHDWKMVAILQWGGTGGSQSPASRTPFSRLPYVFVPLSLDSRPLLCFSRYHVNHAV